MIRNKKIYKNLKLFHSFICQGIKGSEKMGQEDFVRLFRRLVESQKMDEVTAQLLLKKILSLLYGDDGDEAKPPGPIIR